MKSTALTAAPTAVAMRNLPELVAGGTGKASCVGVTEASATALWLSFAVVAPAT